MSPKLLAVYLGGRAPKCNTELHDVVFVVGSSIEATYEQLLDRWFGDPLQMHIDSWMALEVVDQYRVTLRREPATQPEKLFFVNLGAYRPGEFTELHANLVLVAEDREQAKQRAKRELLRGAVSVHKDDLFDVDDCLPISQVDAWHIHLEPTGETASLVATSAYHVIPPNVLRAYAERRGLGPTPSDNAAAS